MGRSRKIRSADGVGTEEEIMVLLLLNPGGTPKLALSMMLLTPRGLARGLGQFNYRWLQEGKKTETAAAGCWCVLLACGSNRGDSRQLTGRIAGPWGVPGSQ